MATATITSKGQITVPKAVRDRLGLKPGHKVQFEFRGDGEVVLRAKTVDLLSLAGLLKRPQAQPRSLAEIDRGLGEAVAASYRRSVRSARARRARTALR